MVHIGLSERIPIMRFSVFKIKKPKGEWKEAKISPKSSPGEAKKMRGWQKECFDDFYASGKNNIILNAPTGSGKTLEMCYLSSDFIAKNIGHKAIICVPQTIIAAAFVSDKKNKPYKLKFPDGTIREWYIEKDLCKDPSSEESKSNKLIKFLSENISDRFQDRTILCTHQTLGRVFKRLKEEDNLNLLKNIYLWIDEGHHSMSTENGSNNIGEIGSYFQSNPEKNFIINYATATFFRGDRLQIAQNVESFFRFNLPYDKYFEGLNWLKSFSYDFLLHKYGWFKAIKTIFKDKIGKTIVYMPSLNSRHSTGDKYQEVWEVIWAIAGRRNAKYTEDPKTGVITIHKNGKDIVIVDLVDEDKREEKKEFIRENGDKVDVIINIKVFSEGADWPEANREIIIGEKNSLNQIMQMIGRLFRDHESKDGIPVEVVQVFPYVSQKIDGDKFQEKFNDYMKAIDATLLLEMIINPVVLSVPSSKKAKKKEIKINEAKEYFLDKVGRSESINIIEEIGRSWVEFRDMHPEIKSKKDLEEASIKVVSEGLKDCGIELFNVELTEMLVASFKRATTHADKILKPLLKGIDVSNINFNIIKEKDPIFGFRLAFASLCGIKDLKELRKVLDTFHGLWMENYEKVKEFVEKKGEYPSEESKIEEEQKIGRWCGAQRQNKKGQALGKITEERIKLLESIPNWKWDVISDNWNETFNNLKLFYSKNNKCANRCSMDEEEKILGVWIDTQKANKKENILTEYRIKLLETIPGWKWDLLDEKWMENYEKVKEFVKTNNKYPSHHSKNEEEKSLGMWVGTQKQSKKGNRANNLTPKRTILLEDLPEWIWEIDLEEKWMEKYNIVKLFNKKDGKYPSQHSKDKKEKRSSLWISKQKSNKRKDKLTKKQIILLEKLPDWEWDNDLEEKWMEKYNIVKLFYSKNNKCANRCSTDEEEKILGRWIDTQKSNKKKNILTEEQIKLLNTIPGWKWNVFSDKWNKKFNSLKSFYLKNNKYPSQNSKDKEEKSLGMWIGTQKKSKKGQGTCKLTPDQIKQLETLPNWKW
jgi:superfamily II DNA or RNA helicase